VAGLKRLNGIIGMGNPHDEYYHGDEAEYGLGQVRSKEKFFKLFCSFVGKPMQHMFLPHLRENGMGINVDEIDYECLDTPKNGRREKENIE
jgi:hypothetical protein